MLIGLEGDFWARLLLYGWAFVSIRDSLGSSEGRKDYEGGQLGALRHFRSEDSSPAVMIEWDSRERKRTFPES